MFGTLTSNNSCYTIKVIQRHPIVYFAENVQSTTFDVILSQHSKGVYF